MTFTDAAGLGWLRNGDGALTRLRHTTLQPPEVDVHSTFTPQFPGCS